MGEMHQCAGGLRWKIMILQYNKWAAFTVVMTWRWLSSGLGRYNPAVTAVRNSSRTCDDFLLNFYDLGNLTYLTNLGRSSRIRLTFPTCFFPSVFTTNTRYAFSIITMHATSYIALHLLRKNFAKDFCQASCNSLSRLQLFSRTLCFETP
jgi:hypothetical protein